MSESPREPSGASAPHTGSESAADPQARYPMHTGARSRAVGVAEESAAERHGSQGTDFAGDGRDDGASVAQAQPRGKRSFGGHLLAGMRELLIVGTIALVLSFLVKTFLIQAFYIPSESMESTLVKDDRVIVSKLTPRLIDLHRGDVVVFADPNHWLSPQPTVDRGPVLNAVSSALTFVGLLPDTAEGHLIKRVIGLPGDRVHCCDTQGRLEINGKAVNEPYVKAGENPSDIDFDITVPKDRIWVMGDNRGHSSDSRLHDPDGTGSEGSVPVDSVVGRAVLLVWPFNRASWLSNHADAFASVPAAP